MPTLEEKMKDLKALKVEQLQKLYKDFYGANHLEVAFIGSFDAADIKKSINKNFGTWKSKKPFKRITKPYKAALNESATVSTPDKEMAIVAMAANMELSDFDPDYPAVRLANYIFGESMKSYLMQRLREKEGLSYGAGSWINASKLEPSGSISMYAMAATDNAKKALDIMGEEYKKWLNTPINKDLIEESKLSFKSTLDNLLANDNYVVHTLSADLEIGRTFSYQKKLLEDILKLNADEITTALQKYLSKQPIAKVKAGDFKN